MTARIGTDVVALSRIERAVAAAGDVFVGRFLTDDERRWCGEGRDRVARVAACWAVKEAAVKAVGGRPDGFTWQDVAIDVDGGVGGEAGNDGEPDGIDALGAALQLLWPGGELHRAPCRVTGSAANERLWAAWCAHDGFVAAAVTAA